MLFGAAGPPAELAAEPDCFGDLNLDQVVAAVARAAPDRDLPGYFHHLPRDPELVRFRQDVFRDLDDPAVRDLAERFAGSMRGTRRRLAVLERLHHPPQHQRWYLEIALDHAAAVAAFAAGLADARLASAGLRAVRDDLAALVDSTGFRARRERARRLRERLDAVRYDLLLRDDTITVAPPDPAGAVDFGARVRAVFARFQGPPPPDYRRDLSADLGLDEVEAAVLDLVARLCPELFAELAAFRAESRPVVSAEVDRLDRELAFYLGYLGFLAPLRAAGLPVCWPEVSDVDRELAARDCWDLALAALLVPRGEPVVGNDLRLTGPERVLVVSGPNQGGKTTLSRVFGQLHHLAALGCPVPAARARVFLADRVLTHFGRAESLDSLDGKLADELRRMRALLERATPDSVLVLNEVFTSTTLPDATALSDAVLARILDLGAACLWVTFLDELSRRGERVVSMVAAVADDDAATRTFRVERAPADGRAHALTLARRHGLTYQQLTARIRR